MSYFESLGFDFKDSNGKRVVVHKSDDHDYFWFPTNPYKIHHPNKWQSTDIFDIVSKFSTHKSYWQEKCQEDLEDLLSLNDVASYQIKVNTQDLTRHEDDVHNFLNNYQILKISSPMATRKSNIINEVVEQCNERGIRVLFITNRVSLSVDIAEKHKVKHYQDYDYEIGDSLVVQFDSLNTFIRKDNPKRLAENFDVVILDEITSLMLYMADTYSGKEERYRDNLNAFLSLQYKKFVIADSFIIDFPFGGETLGIYNAFREDIKVIEYLDKWNFIGSIRLFSTSGLISVSSNEKAFLFRAKRFLEREGKRVLMLTGDTKDKQSVYKLLSQDEIPFDAILFSPTLTVGVSIFPKVVCHFHYDTSGTIDAISSLQMLRRARNNTRIHYHIRGRSSYKATSYRDIKRNMKDFMIINEWNEPTKLSTIGHMLSIFRHMKNILANTHKYAFKALLYHQFKGSVMSVNSDKLKPFPYDFY